MLSLSLFGPPSRPPVSPNSNWLNNESITIYLACSKQMSTASLTLHFHWSYAFKLSLINDHVFGHWFPEKISPSKRFCHQSCSTVGCSLLKNVCASYVFLFFFFFKKLNLTHKYNVCLDSWGSRPLGSPPFSTLQTESRNGVLSSYTSKSCAKSLINSVS